MEDMAKTKKELAAKRKELEKSKQRITELDSLFKRLYEDYVGQRLTNERFEKLSVDYEDEQEQLVERVTIRKYTDIQELTPTLLESSWTKLSCMSRTEVPASVSRKLKYTITLSGMFQGRIPIGREAP